MFCSKKIFHFLIFFAGFKENKKQLPENKVIAGALGKCSELKAYMKKAMPFAEVRKVILT